MEVERISKEDLIKLVYLEKRAFEVGPYTIEMLEYALYEAGDMAFKIEDQGKIVAYLMAAPVSGTSIDIESIAVDPDYRGKGFAKILFTFTEKLAREKGYKKIELEVREFNREAIGLYERLGFSKAEFLENYYIEKYEGSRNAYRMEKDLGE